MELVLFTDIGAAWKDLKSTDTRGIHISWGPGYRLCWGEDFIVAVNVGFWNDSVRAYVGLNQQF
jgi:hypothetical protein